MDTSNKLCRIGIILLPLALLAIILKIFALFNNIMYEIEGARTRKVVHIVLCDIVTTHLALYLLTKYLIRLRIQ